MVSIMAQVSACKQPKNSDSVGMHSIMTGLASFGASSSLKAFQSAALKLGQGVSSWAVRVRAKSVITGMLSVLARHSSGSMVQQVMSLASWQDWFSIVA